jgi:thioester reductase-like protein
MSELPGEVDPAVIKEKCVPIEGDLSKPLLGLSQTDYNFLSNEVNVVIHNGANVNHILNYHDLKATNVRSTKEIIKFCCQGNPKFLHYVSSLGVFLVNPMEKVNENTNPDQKW